jgi:hypothetical protein
LRRRLLTALAAQAAASACARLDSIPSSPPRTPQEWLAVQPWTFFEVASHRVIVVQPSTTIIVSALSILALLIGVRFLRSRDGQLSRFWWGVGLLLWGTGGLLAGASYEAFSYAIKCEGRAVCAWTSWFEVAYLILTAWSINAMMLAEAQACSAGGWRQAIALGAGSSALAYSVVVLVGAMVPIRFLVSFELLVLVAAPSILVCLALRASRYRLSRARGDLAALGTWLWLILCVVAYYAYLVLGVSEALWTRGIWFTENDVLHLGLIAWMLSVVFVLAPLLRDAGDERS